MDGISPFDGFAIILLLSSGFLALVRGFVREALSVTAFVAAALASLWARPVFIGLAEEFVGPGWAANITVMGAVFVLVFLAVSFVTGSLRTGVKQGEDVGVIDRTLGFGFGLLRGLVLLGLILIVFVSATPGAAAPAWMSEARVYPLVNASARTLQSLAPEDSRIGQSPVISAPDENASSSREESYDDRDRGRLDELIGDASEEDDGWDFRHRR